MGGVMFTRCDACLRVEGTGGGAGCVDVLEGLGAGGANAWAWCAVGWVGCWPSGVGGQVARVLLVMDPSWIPWVHHDQTLESIMTKWGAHPSIQPASPNTMNMHGHSLRSSMTTVQSHAWPQFKVT